MKTLNNFSNKSYKNSYGFLIIVLSLAYGYVMNLGLYGFGKDFHGSYGTGNLYYGGYEDRLGWIIASMKVGDFHIGVFITSFLLAYSTLKLAVHVTERTLKKRLDILIFIIFALLILHSWPILMSTSNAMRQGIMMSFLYLSLISIDKQENFKSFCFVGLMLLSHKSGLMYLSIILSATVFNRFIKGSNNSLLYSILLVFFFAFLINFLPESRDKTIGYDFSFVWLIIGLMTLLYLRPRDQNRNIFSAYVYIWLLFSPILYFNIATFQFERVWMVNVILVMLVVTNRFKKNQITIITIFELAALVALTFVTGMFASLT